MPRNTPKHRHNGSGNFCGSQTTALPPISNVVSKTASMVSKRVKAVKKEPDSGMETVTEQVFHRKSERRRVARDIFLVFEEQPSTRRSRGSNKKQAKPKFGHLKVEDAVKPKGLLRDIKNEPKCYLSSNSSVSKSRTKETVKINFVDRDSKSHFDVWSSTSCSHGKSAKLKNVEPSKVSQDVQVHSKTEESPIIARVNPIFLWAKQDNSRIIEVRCEDYDKRNRIRITKTSNGWRAIPRSDPTSSKVLKLYTSPLIKVKRENHISVANHISQTPATNFSIENKPIVESSDINTLTPPTEITINRLQNTSVKKSKKKKSKKRKKPFTCRNIVLCSNTTVIGDSHQAATRKLPVADIDNNESCPQGDCMDKEVCVVKEDDSPQNYTLPDGVSNGDPHIMNEILGNSSPFKKISPDEDFVDGAFHDECSFQLCPKTGLFLRRTYGAIENGIDDDLQIVECNSNNSLEIDRHKKLVTENKPISVEENHESLEAKTRNLKDLLDDADLFQNCDDNANSDADLIDTLVKSSCEHNLLHDNETSVKEALDPSQNKDTGDTTTEDDDLAQLITDVSEPPKCLSFNEAGEIEALNCELFQSNAYMDTFEKQTLTTISDAHISIHTVGSMQPMSELESATQDSVSAAHDVVHSDKSCYASTNIVEDSPKDLSYKKREEVCPPSESRSQCAVTSSSDVIKSPNRDDTSVLASSSETLKNLILEQFIKLNTISSHTKKNPIELDKQAKTMTQFNTLYAKSLGTTTNDIETVVIDDDDSALEINLTEGEAEPLKKRLRSSAVLKQSTTEADVNIKAKMVMIDKDPDPLTQLQLLIRNSQWKVPDPILVPKDRLSAVLASPAREIPLLITTRPELRLPEAFAYPEIIQNPNILVISMAQLEAILKNDLEINKSRVTDHELEQASLLHFKQHSGQSEIYSNDFHAQTQHQIKQTINMAGLHQRESGSTSTLPINSLSKEEDAKCSHLGSSTPSEINAATMAVLNQMLWLPYFGQISQDFLKSINTPHSLTEKMASLLPFCGTQNIESMCEKNTQTPLSSLQNVHAEITGGRCANTAPTPVIKQGKMDEMALLQKVLQHQIQNAVSISQSKNISLDPQNITPNHSTTKQSAHTEPANSNQSNIRTTNNKNTYLSKNNKDVEQNSYNILDVASKTYNLRRSIASRQISESNHSSNMKRSNSDNKPRVTCKSLSNLLDPEHSQPHNMSLTSSSLIPVVSNVETNFQQNINGLKGKSTMDNIHSCRIGEPIKDSNVLKSLIRSCTSNNADAVNVYNKQNNKMMEDISSDNGTRNVEPSMLPTETNVPLWHPLFGSNSKSAYSSPWQWTTVTAAGE